MFQTKPHLAFGHATMCCAAVLLRAGVSSCISRPQRKRVVRVTCIEKAAYHAYFVFSRSLDLVTEPGPASGPINFPAHPLLEVAGEPATAKDRVLLQENQVEGYP